MEIQEELHIRLQILERLIALLQSGNALTAREMATLLQKDGIELEKGLINSVLFSEGKRYVQYDYKSHRYVLSKPASSEKFSLPTSLVSTTSNADVGQQNGHLKAQVVKRPMPHSFRSTEVSSYAFFDGARKGREYSIRLNSDHPIHKYLSEILESDDLGHSSVARDCLEYILLAWVKYETSLMSGKRLEYAKDAREDWGRQLRDMISESNGDE